MTQKKDYGVRLGDTIRIINMSDPYTPESYNGREGVVKLIDSKGQLHGTWGGLAVIPGVDTFAIIQRTLDPSLPEEIIGGGPSPSRQRRAAESNIQMMID